MAPEVIMGQQHGFTADYFAIGVILHELMIGKVSNYYFIKRPFPGIIRKEYKESIIHMNPSVKPKDVPNGWAPEVADLINSLISRKEDERLGKNGAKSIKSHSWFSGVNWDDIVNKKYPAPFIPNNVILNIKVNIR